MEKNKHSRFERGNGILLHLTSLPGEYGIGNLGKSAYNFVDYLKEGGQKYWQILPIGPVSSGYSYSPYSSHSSFAGNPLLIDPVSLQEESWMQSDILSELKSSPDTNMIDFPKIESKMAKILHIAMENFENQENKLDKENFRKFCEQNKNWLDDFALFKALSEKFNSYNWRSWEEGLKYRKAETIVKYVTALSDEIRFFQFEQYIFEKQWRNLKNYCKKNNILIIGDIPIYAGMDSSDVWADTDIFQFGENFFPDGVSGVPPDYFSQTGQKWGNPLYRWFRGEKPNIPTYNWWLARTRRLLDLVDIVRIDHFRGFESYWNVNANSPDGKNGKWEKGPGEAFFNYLNKNIGNIPIIAEDLGIITENVENLRKSTGFPGMKILQFAFDRQPDNPYIPENITDPNCVIYTGTHDNNTSLGWFANETGENGTKEYIKSYLGIENNEDFLWKFIECSIHSNADISIIPFQDVLGLGKESRMNTPGTSNNTNWRWKAANTSFIKEKMEKLKELCEQNGRIR